MRWMTLGAALVGAMLAQGAWAKGPQEALDQVILPAFAGFKDAAQVLETESQNDCTAPALAAPYNAAFDAWIAVEPYAAGPIEDSGFGRAIAFWPDSRGATPTTIRRLIAEADPVVADVGSFRSVSIAARGLFGLEMMLFDPEFSAYTPDSYACDLTRAMAADLADMVAQLSTAWHDDFAPLMRTAGAHGNSRFLSQAEVAQFLLTAATGALEFDEAARLARPLGSFERPRPNRAEARRAGRALRNVDLSVGHVKTLTQALVNEEEMPITMAAFARAQAAADALKDDPVFAGVATPDGRLKVEILQQRIHELRERLSGEVGGILGVTAGFNALDGD